MAQQQKPLVQIGTTVKYLAETLTVIAIRKDSDGRIRVDLRRDDGVVVTIDGKILEKLL